MLLTVDMTQHSEEHIRDDCRAGIANMGIGIDRRSAIIHGHAFWILRNEWLLLSCQRIIERERVLRISHVRALAPNVQMEKPKAARALLSDFILSDIYAAPPRQTIPSGLRHRHLYLR